MAQGLDAVQMIKGIGHRVHHVPDMGQAEFVEHPGPDHIGKVLLNGGTGARRPYGVPAAEQSILSLTFTNQLFKQGDGLALHRLKGALYRVRIVHHCAQQVLGAHERGGGVGRGPQTVAGQHGPALSQFQRPGDGRVLNPLPFPARMKPSHLIRTVHAGIGPDGFQAPPMALGPHLQAHRAGPVIDIQIGLGLAQIAQVPGPLKHPAGQQIRL